MGPAATVLLGVAVLAGAGTQRLTGLGFALVASPFLVVVAGPRHGVILANLLSLATNLVVLIMLRRQVNVRRALLLAVPAVCAVPLGAWLAGRLRVAVLELLIGLLVVAALLVVTVARRVRLPEGPAGAVAAGAASGLMNVTAGVGGPAISLYALSTTWDHAEFVASIQLYFALVNGASILAKGGTPGLGLAQVVVCVAALALGTVAGQWLTSRVPADRARQAVLVLAYAGGLTAAARGAVALLSGS